MTLKPYNKEIRNSYYKTYREYTKLRKYKKKHFKQSTLNKLGSLEKEDPKAYWNLVNSLKEEQKLSPESSINSNTWIDYFASLNSVNLHHVERVNALNEMVKNLENNKTFSELDSRITVEEIKIAISSLKTNKAAGLDRISNEMIKAAGELIIPYLHKMFNTIFSSGQYPNSWASAYIKPLLKKGDPKLPENYRGIAINPSIAKLFNLILNKRLDKFLTDRNCIDSCQIGFSKNARTSDHMFVLKCLIDKYASSYRNKMYTCFIDFKKAFDTVTYPGIKYKLLQLGIGGYFYRIIDSMYSNSTLCVKIDDNITNSFQSYVGVRQGDVLSPNLFKIFVNDIPKYLSGSMDAVELNGKNVECLLYADDVVLFSSSAAGLQQRLNSLSKFCKDWCLDVNVDKTNVLVFNKAGRLSKEKFYFDAHELECVQHYRYLGVHFSASGSFSHGIDEIYQKASKAFLK